MKGLSGDTRGFMRSKRLTANDTMDDSSSVLNKSSDDFKRVAAEELYQLLFKHLKPFKEVIRQVGDAALTRVLEETKQEDDAIVDDEAFPDYAIPKKTAGRKKRRENRRAELPGRRRAFP
jgi:hypothetical protein